MARSGKRSVTVHQFPTTEPNKFIKVSVRYAEGGGATTRGFFMHFTPVAVEYFDGHAIEKFRLFSGCKALIEEARRYSEKRMLALADQIRGECERRGPHIMRIVHAVLSEEKLELVPEPEVTL